MRTILKTIFLAPALVLAVACNKDKPADPSLNADLGLAAQANSARLDSITAAERTKAAVAAAPAPVAVRPAQSDVEPVIEWAEGIAERDVAMPAGDVVALHDPRSRRRERVSVAGWTGHGTADDIDVRERGQEL